MAWTWLLVVGVQVWKVAGPSASVRQSSASADDTSPPGQEQRPRTLMPQVVRGSVLSCRRAGVSSLSQLRAGDGV